MPISKASGQAVAVAAKGDLVVGSATNDAAVLGVGSADQVLTVDSSTTTGLKWATPSSGGMTLLSTTTLSGNSTTISSISSAYTHLFALVYAVNPSSTVRFDCEPNSVTNNTDLSIVTNGSAVSNINDKVRLSGTLETLLTGSDRNAWGIWFYNYASTVNRKPINFSGFFSDNGGNYESIMAGGGFASTSAISSLRFVLGSAATFTTGTVLLYGVK